MPYNSKTGSEAGKKSKRGNSKNADDVRQLFSRILENNMDSIQKDLDKLEPKDRLECLLKVARFVLPTLRSIDMMEYLNTRDSKPMEVVFNYTPEERDKRIKELLKKI